MMKSKIDLNNYLLIFVLGVTILLSACKKQLVEGTSLKITSLSPNHGAAGSIVNILGEGFNQILSEDSVRFNGTIAKIISATNIEINVEVPAQAGTGTVALTIKGKTVRGPIFSYEKSPQPYISGSSPNQYGGNLGATYWKNKTPIYFPTGSLDASLSSIAISGNDIYVAGFKGNQIINVATYWKNGIEVGLAPNTTNSYARSIFVSGSDIYVAGGIFTSPNMAIATYWKNGIPVSLSDRLHYAEAKSIVVSGSDVYVAGWVYSTSGIAVATYWKNGKPVILTNGLANAELRSILVIGNDVYVSGYTTSPSGNLIATYWKNNVETKLTINGSENECATSVAILGNDIYIAGYIQPSYDDINPVYWKNNIIHTLPESLTSTTFANSIVVSGDDVFVVGVGYEPAPYSRSFALFWKNGNEVFLENNTNGAAFSIALKYE